jgi:D-3-phosphoglycerate dehydrogenase / 2-oxoglutarate reductase
MHLLVLDSLYDSLDVEHEEAARLGWTLARWRGTDGELGEADAVAHVRTPVDRELIALLTRCKVVARFGTGLDTVDLEAAREADISVFGVRDYCVPELCSHTLALAFALTRRLPEIWRERAVDTRWQDFSDRLPIGGGTRATVVGLGSIGLAVASALASIGFEVAAVTRRAAAAARARGIPAVDLNAGLAQADVVFLHAALEPETERLIEERRLAQMRAGTVLIDTARLGLLDEAATAAAVISGHLGGLGLDAHLGETSPLRQVATHPRVLITPHVGWYSERSARELRVRTIRAAIEACASRIPVEAER